jgi:hypothetical protein
MRFDINEFQEDEEKKSEGVWCDIGAGARIRVASLGNEAFQDWFRKKTAPWTRLKKDVPENVQREIMIEGMARHVLVDWEGVYEGDVALVFSVETAIRVMTKIRWFADRVLEEAREYSNFCVDAAEEIEGN